MNPSPPHWYYFPLSMDAFRQGNDDAALLWAERIELPSFFWTDALLAAIYGQLGRSGDAAGAVDRLLTLYPDFEERALIELGHQQFEPAVLDRLVNGLRKAGLTIAQPATNTGQHAYGSRDGLRTLPSGSEESLRGIELVDHSSMTMYDRVHVCRKSAAPTSGPAAGRLPGRSCVPPTIRAECGVPSSRLRTGGVPRARRHRIRLAPG